MMLISKVDAPKLSVGISLKDDIAVLGSCFADSIGTRLTEAGFKVCVNPFGTIYNPSSIAMAVERLSSCTLFKEDDCVRMGAGADLICSFQHHTSFARHDAQSFLSDANRALCDASAYWRKCRKVIITLGTARVWKHSGEVVSNCLKRPGTEFESVMLSPAEVATTLRGIVDGNPDKEFIFTVSPIRHLGRGAHDNTLSKSTLQLGLSEVTGEFPDRVSYFPAFEIFLDELRDYRFCAEDLAHPTDVAVRYIWERFLESAVPAAELDAIEENEKASRRARHKSILE